jgi:hypothetical protein
VVIPSFVGGWGLGAHKFFLKIQAKHMVSVVLLTVI